MVDSSLLQTFAESTSAHGFVKINRAPDGSHRKKLWVLWVCTCYVALVAHITLNVINFVRQEPTTNTLYRNSTQADLKLGITICPSHTFSYLRILRKYQSLKKYIHAARNIPIEHRYQNVDIADDIWIPYLLGQNKSLLSGTQVHMKDLILLCNFEVCKENFAKKIILTKYFVCYTTRINSTRMGLSEFLLFTERISDLPESQRKIVERDMSIFFPLEDEGTIIFVHTDNQFPDLNTR